MRIVLCGLGSIGRRHLRNVRELLPAADISVLRHARTNEPAPPEADRVIYSLDDACALQPAAALICGPTTAHAEAAVALAGAGAHLFVEKPIAETVAAAQRILDAARDRIVFVAYNLRFSKAVQRFAAEISSGAIGPIGYLRAEVGQYLPDWRPGSDYRTSNTARNALGGGLLLELSHEIDYCNWIAGPFESVSATLARTSALEIDVDDTAELTLRSRGGALVSIHLDMTQRAVTRLCKAVGAEGTLVLDAVAGSVACYRSGIGWQDVLVDARGRNDMYVDELRHFFECIEGRAVPLIDGQAATAVVAIAEAAQRSNSEGRTITL